MNLRVPSGASGGDSNVAAEIQSLKNKVDKLEVGTAQTFAKVSIVLEDEQNATRYFVIENEGVWRVNKRDDQGVISFAESATQVTNLTEARNLTYA